MLTLRCSHRITRDSKPSPAPCPRGFLLFAQSSQRRLTECCWTYWWRLPGSTTRTDIDCAKLGLRHPARVVHTPGPVTFAVVAGLFSCRPDPQRRMLGAFPALALVQNAARGKRAVACPFTDRVHDHMINPDHQSAKDVARCQDCIAPVPGSLREDTICQVERSS
jgi:hypothetical protein